jgi:hypothetical protein
MGRGSEEDVALLTAMKTANQIGDIYNDIEKTKGLLSVPSFGVDVDEGGSKKGGADTSPEAGHGKAEADISNKKEAIDRYMEMKRKMGEQDDAIALNNIWQEKAANDTAEVRIGLIREEIELLKVKREMNHKNAEMLLREEKIEKLKALEDIGYGFEFEGEGDTRHITNYMDIMKAKYEEMNDHRNEEDQVFFNTLKEKISDIEDDYKRVGEIESEIRDQKKDYLTKDLEIVKAENDILEIEKEKTDELKKQKEAQTKVYEERKDALEKLLDITKDMLKQEQETAKAEKETNIDALEKQIDNYSKIIDKKKEILDLTEDQHDYEKSLAEKQKDIGKIQNRILELSRDNSRAAQAERLELEEDLTEKTDDLTEFQRDRRVELNKQALDDSAKTYEEKIKGEIDAEKESIKIIEKYLAQEGLITFDAMQEINTMGEGYQDRLLKFNETYGDSIQTNIIDMLTKSTEALGKFADDTGKFNFSGTMTTLNERIETNTKLTEIMDKEKIEPSDMPTIAKAMESNSADWNKATTPEKKASLEQENIQLDKLAGSTYDETTGLHMKDGKPLYVPQSKINSTRDQMKANSAKYNSASGWYKTILNTENKKLAESIGAVYNDGDGRYYLDGVPLYHDGVDAGFVGERSINPQSEQFAKLMKGEMVINPTQMQNFMTNILPKIPEAVSSAINNNMNIGKLLEINVEGNLDKKVVPDIKNIVDEAVKKINETFSNRGRNRPVKSYSF